MIESEALSRKVEEQLNYEKQSEHDTDLQQERRTEALWVEEYSPKRYTELISDEVCVCIVC